MILLLTRARTKSIEASFDHDDVPESVPSHHALHRDATMEATIDQDDQEDPSQPMALEFQRVSITGDDTSGVGINAC